MANWLSDFFGKFGDAFGSNFKDGYDFGDVSGSIIQGIFGGAGSAVSNVIGGLTGSKDVWGDLTGKNNTAAQNAAAAALQEDAQAFNAEEAEKTRQFDAEQANLTREFNALEAEKNRQWQEQMSNSAYQRGMADMKAAGLNPWLMAGGSGASTGSGAVASSGMTSSQNANSAVASAQASNVNMLASIGTAAAGLGLLIKALKYVK